LERSTYGVNKNGNLAIEDGGLGVSENSKRAWFGFVADLWMTRDEME